MPVASPSIMPGLGRTTSSSSDSSYSDPRTTPSNRRHWWQITPNRNRRTARGLGTDFGFRTAESLLPPPHSSSHIMPRNTNLESSPLLRNPRHDDSDDDSDAHVARNANKTNPTLRAIVWCLLTLIILATLVVFVCFEKLVPDSVLPWVGIIPRDPTLAALAILKVAPVIDGHIDLPILVRELYANNISAVDLRTTMPRQVDIPRLRKGKVGGFFWSVYVPCPDLGSDEDFTEPSWRVRDTLEQVDVARSLIDKYPRTFQLALSSDDVVSAITNGKIASLLGVEGGHQLGNSISVLRQYYTLGVRYVTLTHTCHNAFADSSGSLVPLHYGLSPFGLRLIDEMNRLGVLVDLSHTSDATALQALNYSRAPVIWSHSSARAVHNVKRNIPDKVLRLVGNREGQKDAVIMVNFVPEHVAAPGNATVASVADHVEHIARITGKDHVGLGSDFDGMEGAPTGLEDASKYPGLIAELYSRGWDKFELAGLTGGNVLRVLQEAERVAKELQETGTAPVYDLYDKRTDIPEPLPDL